MKAIDGLTWNVERNPTYHSFTTPNAICPVCGAAVFFHQSPYGGRVFFDELGPPWPKHPCTSRPYVATGRSTSFDFVIGPVPVATTRSAPLFALDEWRPLLSDEVTRIGTHDRVRMAADAWLPGTYLHLPSGWVGSAPAFWRWSALHPELIEVSCIKVDVSNEVNSAIFLSPSWIDSDQQFELWYANQSANLSAETLNKIGFSYSFGWKIDGVEDWETVYPGVNFTVARHFFERSAREGYWPALNNLGVLYRDGLGCKPNPQLAFEHFQRAAQSLQPIPLRHLAGCYRNGTGCATDLQQVVFLEELAAASDPGQ